MNEFTIVLNEDKVLLICADVYLNRVDLESVSLVTDYDYIPYIPSPKEYDEIFNSIFSQLEREERFYDID